MAAAAAHRRDDRVGEREDVGERDRDEREVPGVPSGEQPHAERKLHIAEPDLPEQPERDQKYREADRAADRGDRRGAGAGGGAGGSSCAAGSMGERRPLALFLHGFLGALPHGDGIHGGGKNVAFGGWNSWVEESSTS